MGYFLYIISKANCSKMKPKQYKIKSKVWLYPGMAGTWHFATVDKEESKEIKETYGKHHRGFGSIPVHVTVGKTNWKTSIFWSKEGTYVLPLKAQVRKKESIFEDDTIMITLKF